MEVQREDDYFIFNSVECGRKGKTYCLCDKSFATETEAWLDANFIHILINYRSARCLTILGDISHVRCQRNARTTLQISA